MSLWRWKRTLVRAVAGELSSQEELRLREHLRGCADCMTFYDRLVETEEGLANLRHGTGGGHGAGASATSAAREEARLREALGFPSSPLVTAGRADDNLSRGHAAASAFATKQDLGRRRAA